MKLAEPRYEGAVALERCLALRRSVRDFRDVALKSSELGQLLWAAQGLTGAGGFRAAPSAGALYPLEIYAAIGKVESLAQGVYRYLVARHELTAVATGDCRKALAAAALDQDWIASAAAVICIASVFERTTAKYGRRGHGYVLLEAGHAAENLLLQAVALGLGATMVGAFDDEGVARSLRLRVAEQPLCLIPIGRV